MPIVENFADTDRIKTKQVGLALDNYIRDQYFFIRFQAAAIRRSGALTAISSFPAVTMADATTDTAEVSAPLPTHWRKGNVQVDLLWCSSDASAAVVRWQARVRLYQLGGDGNNDWVANATTDAATAGTANQLQRTTICQSTTPVGLSNKELVSIDIERQGSHANDTSTTSAFILGLILEYQPSQSQ